MAMGDILVSKNQKEFIGDIRSIFLGLYTPQQNGPHGSVQKMCLATPQREILKTGPTSCAGASTLEPYSETQLNPERGRVRTEPCSKFSPLSSVRTPPGCIGRFAFYY